MPQPPALIAAPGLRLRHEFFGALAWRTDPRRIWRLDDAATAVVLLHDRPRPTDPGDTSSAVVAKLGMDMAVWHRTIGDLVAEGVLVGTDQAMRPTSRVEAAAAARRIATATPTVEVLKPMWVHIQPFTRCNQHCLHCYCSGGPKADLFQLAVPTWRTLVARLDEYGVFSVYVTGGESLMLDGFFDLAEEILGRGMEFGLSTNATVLSDKLLDRLRELRLGTVQVSLDGGSAAVHELVRGAPGSFIRTLEGIDRVSKFSTVVINTVVNTLNLDQLEQVVTLGQQHGCTRFKFFPQKPVGRASHPRTRQLVLSDEDIRNRLVPDCARLAQAYGAQIETIDPAQPCGSGSLGFAVDQRGDVYPCIFGVETPGLRCGNLLTDDLDDLWFGSAVLDKFRGEVSMPCHRCEPSCP